MNFNIYIFIFIFLLFGCGVKSDPKKYPETAIPSYIEKYEKEEHSNKPKPTP